MAALLVSLWVGPALAARTDVVVFRNGDHLTGEVKQLTRGKLNFKTDDAGTVKIEWDKIQSVQSIYQFEVETEGGDKYFGGLAVAEEPGHLRVDTPGGPVDLPIGKVIRLERIGINFWQRVDGSVSAGLNLTKANHSVDLETHGDLTFRSMRHLVQLTVDSSLLQQEDADDTSRSVVQLEHHRFFKSSTFGTFDFAQVESNEELGLDLRAQIAGGGLVELFPAPDRQVTAGVGLAFSRESFAGDEPTQSSFELLFAAEMSIYRFDRPQIDVTLSGEGYPSLSDWGRYRGQLDLSFRYELLKDFFLGINGYLTYDNEPPEGETDTTDWGLGTSLGWSF